MIKSLTLLCSVAILFLAGCATFKGLPPGVTCETWTHTDNYGPFQDHITASGISKQPDGSFKVGNYVGNASFMGFGPSDQFHDLVILPALIPATPVNLSTAPAK